MTLLNLLLSWFWQILSSLSKNYWWGKILLLAVIGKESRVQPCLTFRAIWCDQFQIFPFSPIIPTEWCLMHFASIFQPNWRVSVLKGIFWLDEHSRPFFPFSSLSHLLFPFFRRAEYSKYIVGQFWKTLFVLTCQKTTMMEDGRLVHLLSCSFSLNIILGLFIWWTNIWDLTQYLGFWPNFFYFYPILGILTQFLGQIPIFGIESQFLGSNAKFLARFLFGRWCIRVEKFRLQSATFSCW